MSLWTVALALYVVCVIELLCALVLAPIRDDWE